MVDAYKELRELRRATTPTAKQTPHMRELLADVTARLVRHELYVARFYLKKDNYEAAVARIQYALKRVRRGADRAEPRSRRPPELQAEALLLLGTTYLKMHKWGEARQAFEVIVARYAQSPLRSRRGTTSTS